MSMRKRGDGRERSGKEEERKGREDEIIDLRKERIDGMIVIEWITDRGGHRTTHRSLR